MLISPRALGLALALACAGPVAAAPSAAPTTVEQMEQLIHFLSQRIQDEDPAASPESTRYALFESLEMMGIEVPATVKEGDLDTPALARALIGGGPAAPGPTPGVEASLPPPTSRRPEGAPAPLPLPPPAPTGTAARQVEELTRAFPAIAEVAPYIKPRVMPSAPPLAEMARAILDHPTANPFKPTPKPVGKALDALRAGTFPEPEAGPAGAAPPGPAAAEDMSTRIARMLAERRARREAAPSPVSEGTGSVPGGG